MECTRKGKSNRACTRHPAIASQTNTARSPGSGTPGPRNQQTNVPASNARSRAKPIQPRVMRDSS